MKEEIPESFWEALVEVKDKDIKDALKNLRTGEHFDILVDKL